MIKNQFVDTLFSEPWSESPNPDDTAGHRKRHAATTADRNQSRSATLRPDHIQQQQQQQQAPDSNLPPGSASAFGAQGVSCDSLPSLESLTQESFLNDLLMLSEGFSLTQDPDLEQEFDPIHQAQLHQEEPASYLDSGLGLSNDFSSRFGGNALGSGGLLAANDWSSMSSFLNSLPPSNPNADAHLPLQSPSTSSFGASPSPYESPLYYDYSSALESPSSSVPASPFALEAQLPPPIPAEGDSNAMAMAMAMAAGADASSSTSASKYTFSTSESGLMRASSSASSASTSSSSSHSSHSRNPSHSSCRSSRSSASARGRRARPPHVCPHCQLEIIRSHDLERHLRVHTGEAPYKCPLCKAAFKRSDALSRHHKTVHAAS